MAADIDKSLLDHSENALVEQPSIELFDSLGWETANCFDEFTHGKSPLGRGSKGEVVLVERLRPALQRLNSDLPADAIELAVEELTRDRSVMTLVAANREVYRMLKDGVRVTFRGGEDGDEEVIENVKVIDWKTPTNNDFFLASQFWVAGEMYTRRPDLLGFVNGLPLVFVELKSPEHAAKDAYDDNLSDYKDTIPHLFWYNALVILSNGKDAKVGSITSEWEHSGDWKRIDSEGETGVVSLETMIRGTCEPARLLDLVENFTAFMSVRGGQIKLAGKNHQYLGVNNAIAAVEQIEQNKGRLGVFWHTQGSGKSISMIFFSQKILRRLPGHWTFVIITDRKELDEQIYKNFTGCGVVTEEEAQATSGENLQQLLREDHRYVFSLIQKFRTDKFQKYPKLSDRSDIIVITDEAHRSQYDTLARNMRDALPNASFVAFTGTPLIAGEELTKEVFGDYVSVYNFKQSVEDGATVPLYYENRIPQLQLTNEFFKGEMEQILDEAVAEIDDKESQEAYEKKLEREFAREYHLITRDDRLAAIAADLVNHFLGRGFQGKAMMVCIDKATAVKMYDLARTHWDRALQQRRDELAAAIEDATKYPSEDPSPPAPPPASEARGERIEQLRREIAFMAETDMAVVVSQSQNEIKELAAKGVDIKPHRKRIVKEDLETKFKDKDDPFRLVFVCAMWMTGFDVPSCSTIYMDKPMRNHTLMQTIARANRVFPDKECGTIVDYVGVRNLNKALAIYGDPKGKSAEGDDGDDYPANPKAELVERLKHAIAETVAFCTEKGFDVAAIPRAQGFERVALMQVAVEKILVNDESKKRFRNLASEVGRLYKAILPDEQANEFAPICVAIATIARDDTLKPPEVDISGVVKKVESLLDRSIAAEDSGAYIIDAARAKQIIDLSQIDFEALQEKFQTGRKRTEAEKLRGVVAGKLAQMVRLNKSRIDYLEKFQKMIDEYNAGSVNVEAFFQKLVEFSQQLTEEDQRAVREELSEEELAMFDLLTKPDIRLTRRQEIEVKKIARELLAKLKQEKLVLDWRKRQRTQATVRLCIEEVLDVLPEAYTDEQYEQKCEVAYHHIYESYFGAGRSIYAAA